MKRKYIVIAAACLSALIAVIACVVLTLNRSYFEPLAYDHIAQTAYNGIEVMGNDGLFYLAKDGKILSDGYTYLKSVNDWYSPSLYELCQMGEDVKLFDYYIAKAPDRQNYLLVNSMGDEYTVMGDSYSLLEVTLPYIFFVNNTTGRMAALSLNRLDSDLSYKSGSELTLRPFKNMIPMKSYDEDTLYSYVITDDVAEEPIGSYFDSDGIKIASGRSVDMFSLYDAQKKSILFYDAAAGKIHRLGSDEVVNNVYYLYRSEYSNWRYAVCRGSESKQETVVIITAGGTFALPQSEYVISSLWGYENCLIGRRADGNGYDVINVNSGRKETYGYIRAEENVLVAISKSGYFNYLNGNGVCALESKHGDMAVDAQLSYGGIIVMTSAAYDAEAGGAYLHFAGEGTEAYSLRVDQAEVGALKTAEGDINGDTAVYFVKETVDGAVKYRILAPFSVNKLSAYYDTVEFFCHGDVAWILASDRQKMAYEIVDPFTSRAVGSVKCSEEELAKYAFTHYDNIALATDKSNTESTIPMAVIRLSKYENDDLISRTVYFALYRSAAKGSLTYSASSLRMTELGKDLLIENAYDVYTARNCLVTHSTSGSVVFSLNESRELAVVATVPYAVTDIMTDGADVEHTYFVVSNGDGMFGIYDSGSEEILPPYYEDIISAEDGEFTVKIRGAVGIVAHDGLGTRGVIEPLYSAIIPMGEGGYIAWDGSGNTVIIQNGSVIIDTPIQSVSSVYSFNYDDGELSASMWTTVSTEGKLLIHRSARILEEIYNGYVIQEATKRDEELNDRAKVVYYYEGDALSHTEVIYPEQTLFSLIESPNGKGWFTTTAISTQTLPVTAEDVMNYDGHILRLYSKR